MPRVPRSMYRVQYLLVAVLMLAGLTSSFVLLSYSSSEKTTHTGITQANSTEQAVTNGAPAAEPLASMSQDSASVDSRAAQASEAYGKLPLSFEANEGQADESVKFLSRGSGYGLFLTRTEAVLALRNDRNPQPTVMRVKLLGANTAPEVEGQAELPGKSNHFIGNDPEMWRTGVANYLKVHYRGVYPGIDMVYYGNQRQLEYDFVVAPFADPQAVALSFQGVDALKLDSEGDLLLRTSGGEIRQHKPIVYQEVDGERRLVAGNYVLKGEREVGFEVGHYDASKPLVIDPVLVYSTYLGGSASDQGYGIAVDSAGNAYVTGTTISNDFPVADALQPVRPKYAGKASYNDAFVTKLNPAGTALVYSTYLGGGIAGEIGKGIAVDNAGNAYVTGVTGGGAVVSARKNNFPIVNGFQSTFGGTDDAFVTKLNASGSAIIFSTYLGGDSSDSGEKIVVDAASGDAYVTGSGSGKDFPTTPGAYKQSGVCAGCTYAPGYSYVTKFNAAGTMQWSTLIGEGIGTDIALGSGGTTYITGTGSASFPVTPGAFQQTHSGGIDAIVTKLNAQGNDLVYSTFLGGGIKADRGLAIAVDTAGNAYVTGQTQNAAFPVTTGALDISYNGGEDAFVTKLNTSGTELLYSTFLGGSGKDIARGIGLDASRNVYVMGQTSSANFPTKNSIQGRLGLGEIFLTKFNTAGNAVVYSTFLGAGEAQDLAVTGAGNAFLTGHANRIPVTLNAFQTAKNAGTDSTNHDGFVMRVNTTNETVQTYSISGHVTDQVSGGYSAPLVVTIKGKQNRTTNLNANGNYSFGALPPGAYTVSAAINGFTVEPSSQTIQIVNANETANFTVMSNQEPTATITSPVTGATFTAPASITVTADASDLDGSVAEVKFYASSTTGTSVIGTDTTAPYSVIWNNVPAGNHVISAVITDNLGTTGQSDLSHITVSSSRPPTVTMTSPVNDSTGRAGDYFTVSADVTPQDGATISYVEFYAGTTPIARLSDGAPYTFQWRQTEVGTYSLSARAFDSGGAMGASNPVTVTVTPATSKLFGRIAEDPSSLNGLSGVTVTLSGTRSATVVTGADGMYSFADLPADGSYKVTPSKDGYAFTPAFYATDFLGYYDLRQNFTAVRNTPVSVMITSPSWFARYTAPAQVTISVEASSSAGSISKVDFYANTAAGRVFIGTDTTAPFSMTWDNAPAGDTSLSVIATDSTGATVTSEATPIIIDPAPTNVSISGQVTDGSGTGMNGLRVTLSGSKTATALTNSNGYYGFGSLPAGGSYTVTAPATYTFTPPSQTFDNMTANQYEVNFNTTQFNSAPTVRITSPVEGASFTAPAEVTVSAEALDSDGKVVRVNFQALTQSGTYLSIGVDTMTPYGFIWGIDTPGTYTITATAVDNAGLRTTSAPIKITILPAPEARNLSPLVDLDNQETLASLLSINADALTTLKTDSNLFTPVIWTTTDLSSNKAFEPQRMLVIRPSDHGLVGTDGLRSETGDAWYISNTANGLALTQQWSSQSLNNLVVEGDYNGDGQTDLAIYRPSDGNWYVLKSSHSNS